MNLSFTTLKKFILEKGISIIVTVYIFKIIYTLEMKGYSIQHYDNLIYERFHSISSEYNVVALISLLGLIWFLNLVNVVRTRSNDLKVADNMIKLTERELVGYLEKILQRKPFAFTVILTSNWNLVLFTNYKWRTWRDYNYKANETQKIYIKDDMSTMYNIFKIHADSDWESRDLRENYYKLSIDSLKVWESRDLRENYYKLSIDSLKVFNLAGLTQNYTAELLKLIEKQEKAARSLWDKEKINEIYNNFYKPFTATYLHYK